MDSIATTRLAKWLDRNAPEIGNGPVSARVLSGGASNMVLAVRRDGPEVVLRRPPEKPRPDSDKIIGREGRVLAALAGTDVPHPRFIAACDDLEVIGARFYLMALVDGWLGHHETPPAPFDRPGPERHALGYALVDGIARLAQVDYRAVGLEGFGRPDGFLERQVERWRSQLASYAESEGYAGRDIPGLAYAADWLAANTPEASTPGILHGDYSFANCLFERDTPARVAAMIDWELATVGDPLLDLGWVCYGFRGGDDPNPAGYFDASDFPFREDLADYYAERTGRSVANLTYYMVLAQYKLAVIMERHYARFVTGRQAHSADSENFVLRLAAKAAEMARAHG
jgi:aminoglycoside phosphotransferase (APT) family kinase protein